LTETNLVFIEAEFEVVSAEKTLKPATGEPAEFGATLGRQPSVTIASIPAAVSNDRDAGFSHGINNSAGRDIRRTIKEIARILSPVNSDKITEA